MPTTPYDVLPITRECPNALPSDAEAASLMRTAARTGCVGVCIAGLIGIKIN